MHIPHTARTVRTYPLTLTLCSLCCATTMQDIMLFSLTSPRDTMLFALTIITTMSSCYDAVPLIICFVCWLSSAHKGTGIFSSVQCMRSEISDRHCIFWRVLILNNFITSSAFKVWQLSRSWHVLLSNADDGWIGLWTRKHRLSKTKSVQVWTSMLY